jgi:hypothetical protein
MELEYIENFKQFGFVTEDSIIYRWREYSIDISNYILITKDSMIRCKSVQDLWNYFITIY